MEVHTADIWKAKRTGLKYLVEKAMWLFAPASTVSIENIKKSESMTANARSKKVFEFLCLNFPNTWKATVLAIIPKPHKA